MKQEKNGPIGLQDQENAPENLEERTQQELIQKIQELREEVARLKEEAHKDPLTGALNRRGFEAERRKIKESIAILMLDIDNFKTINTRYGHAQGDAALKEVAAALKRLVRDIDVVGRWGGEEFVVAFRGASAEDVMKKFRDPEDKEGRSRIQIGEVEYEKEKTIPITLSGGVTDLAPGEDIETALKRADDAVRRIKATGKNRLEAELFSP